MGIPPESRGPWNGARPGGRCPPASLNSGSRPLPGHPHRRFPVPTPGEHHSRSRLGGSDRPCQVTAQSTVLGAGARPGRRGVAQVGDQAVFGALPGLFHRLVTHPTGTGHLGQRHPFQPGRPDQPRLDGSDHVLGDRPGQHEIGMPPRRGGLGRAGAVPGRDRRIQGLPDRGEPGPVGRPPQPQHDPRPAQLDVGEFGHEPGQHRGMDIGDIPGEPGRQPRTRPAQRRQPHPHTPDRPRRALGTRPQHQMRPHPIPHRLRAAPSQQPVPDLTQGHRPIRQPRKQPPIHRHRLRAGHQPLERGPRHIQRQPTPNTTPTGIRVGKNRIDDHQQLPLTTCRTTTPTRKTQPLLPPAYRITTALLPNYYQHHNTGPRRNGSRRPRTAQTGIESTTRS